MKIRAYPFLQQEGQAPRAGDNKNTPPASERSLPLPGEKECSRNTGVPDTMGTRIRAHLTQVHTAQEELSSLQEEEKHLAEAEKLYQQIRQLLRQQGDAGKTENMDLLYRNLGKVRNMLAKLKPDFASTDLTPATVMPETEETSNDAKTLKQNDLNIKLANYSAKMEEQRQKLTTRQKELIAAIAHNLVAVENINASRSAIRDDDYAQRVMTEVKETLAKNQHIFPLTQANRQNIAALLR